MSQYSVQYIIIYLFVILFKYESKSYEGGFGVHSQQYMLDEWMNMFTNSINERIRVNAWYLSKVRTVMNQDFKWNDRDKTCSEVTMGESEL